MPWLRQENSANWLVADTSPAEVAPTLAKFAVPRLSPGPVTVHRLG
jgi:hypothetical protein